MDYEKEFLRIVETLGSRNRLSGSKGEKDAIGYMRSYIEKNLPGKTLLQKFKLLTWREKQPARLTVDGKEIDCRCGYYSPSGKIQGVLRYFGQDSEESDNELDVYCIKSKNGTVRAFLYLAKKYDKPFFYNKHSLAYLIPHVMIGAENADFFRKSVGKKVELKIKTKYSVKNSQNLIHKLSDRKGRVKVVVGAHMDTIPDFKGFMDNASGVAGVLIVSHELKKQKLPFDVWMVYFGAEENAMFGSKFFVDTLSEQEKDSIKYMIALDGLGFGEKISLHAEKDYHFQLEKSFESIANQVVLSDLEGVIDFSDHYYFKLLGIDSCFLEGSLGSQYYHNNEADKLQDLNVPLSLKSIEALVNFIQNIEFQSPKIVLEKSRRRRISFLFQKLFS